MYLCCALLKDGTVRCTSSDRKWKNSGCDLKCGENNCNSLKPGCYCPGRLNKGKCTETTNCPCTYNNREYAVSIHLHSVIRSVSDGILSSYIFQNPQKPLFPILTDISPIAGLCISLSRHKRKPLSLSGLSSNFGSLPI